MSTNLYFTANDYFHGKELWRVNPDGSVSLVADINPGTGSSSPFLFTPFMGELYFQATGTGGNELYKVAGDGNVVQVADINLGPDGSGPQDFIEYGGELYFTAASATAGRELWKVAADGTVHQVSDILPGAGSGVSLSQFIVFNGELYFTPRNQTNTFNELWKLKADGTLAQVSPLEFAHTAGVVGSSDVDFRIFDGELYFTATTTAEGQELYKVKTDGSVALVADINPGGASGLTGLDDTFEHSGELYFDATSADGGRELWKITAGGTAVRAADVNPGTADSNPTFLGFAGGELYFSATTAAAGNELWKVTAAGTVVQVVDLNPGTAGSNPSGITTANGIAYFDATTAADGFELWKINPDGSVSLAIDLLPGTGSSVPVIKAVIGGEVYFEATTTEIVGGNIQYSRQLWKLRADGQTVLAFDQALVSNSGQYPIYNGEAYFTAITDSHDAETWKIKSDGSIVQVADINQTINATNSRDATSFNGKFYFSAVSSLGNELWSLDGNGVATQVKDIDPGREDSVPDLFFEHAGALYFVATDHAFEFYDALDQTANRELWKVQSDGSVVLAREINTTVTLGGFGIGSFPREFTRFNGEVYFSASSGRHPSIVEPADTELWKITSTGAVVLAGDINTGSGSSSPNNFFTFNNHLYFDAFTTASGRELWSVDTSGTVQQVADINPGSSGSELSPGTFRAGLTPLGAFNGASYFAARTAAAGEELWRVKTDGTVEQAADLTPGAGNSFSLSEEITVFNGEGYFTGNSKFYKIQADGTAVAITVSNRNSFGEARYTEFNGELYFRAATPSLNAEMWKIKADGTPVFVSSQGPSSEFIPFGGSLYFMSETGTDGLWKLDADGSVHLVSTAVTGFGQYAQFNNKLLLAGNKGLFEVSSDGTVSDAIPGTYTDLFGTHSLGSAFVPNSLTVIGEAGGVFYFSGTNNQLAGPSIYGLTADGRLIVTTGTPNNGSPATEFREFTEFTPRLPGSATAPTITSNGGGATASVSVAENSAAVTTVAASDSDAGTILTYSLVGGADQFKFQINLTSGALSFIAAPNFEAPGDADANNSYIVQVRASDGSLFDDQTITVNVRDVNEGGGNQPPAITSNGGGDNANVSIAESSTAVTTVAATDPDAGTALAYSIVGGADAGKFGINASTGVLSFLAAPDFEVPGDADHDNSYFVQVRASDGSLFDNQAIKVTVTDIDESAGPTAPPPDPDDDSVTAPAGSSRFDGGKGIDTVTFGFRLLDATVTYAGNEVIIDGPSSHTVLTGFERFEFTDGTVDNADGNPLVDDLFYFSRNHDVWIAQMDADLHYDTFGWHDDTLGWHENRDPNAFFSTELYRWSHPDVQAAETNPLTHYAASGWLDNRATSLDFDPAQYLAANPDVVAAHVDPLGHFLLFGGGEGRQPFAPSELFASNGFDFVYYLNNNPDVAAAHFNPFVHFQTVGWQEGRNPNALFDTAGYLATYTDVQAAHINPYDHYLQFGWLEGRDPSVNFDTTEYLGHYPDVQAAQVNPLLHYLNFGIHEGRSTFGDSVWG